MIKASKLVGAAVSIASLAMIGCDDSTDIDFETFEAALSAANEIPPNASTATGRATMVLDQNGILTVRINVDGNLTSAVTGAHIHGPASTATNAAIIFDFTPAMTSVITAGATTGVILDASFDLNALPVDALGILRVTVAELVTMLNNGTAYVNVHTVLNPDGEIRGQVARR